MKETNKETNVRGRLDILNHSYFLLALRALSADWAAHAAAVVALQPRHSTGSV